MITKSRPASVTIGALSERSGVNIETIRYYERVGLVPKPLRSDGGHRLYGKEDLQRLSFIRRARELGFSLDDIRKLLGLATGQRRTCHVVKALTEQHVADIRQKIRDLRKLERILSTLAAQCRGDEVPDCPILDALSAAS